GAPGRQREKQGGEQESDRALPAHSSPTVASNGQALRLHGLGMASPQGNGATRTQVNRLPGPVKRKADTILVSIRTAGRASIPGQAGRFVPGGALALGPGGGGQGERQGESDSSLATSGRRCVSGTCSARKSLGFPVACVYHRGDGFSVLAA